MSGSLGWVVAVVVIVAAGVFYFWPSLMQAPVVTEQGTETSEQGSAAGTQQNSTEVAMSGTWRSGTDEKFTREIRAEGVIIDRYEGEPTAGINGQWSVVADVSAEATLAARAASLAGMTVVKVVWEGGVETTYFAINELDGQSMTITDLSGRGSVTTFAKVN